MTWGGHWSTGHVALLKRHTSFVSWRRPLQAKVLLPAHGCLYLSMAAVDSDSPSAEIGQEARQPPCLAGPWPCVVAAKICHSIQVGKVCRACQDCISPTWAMPWRHRHRKWKEGLDIGSVTKWPATHCLQLPSPRIATNVDLSEWTPGVGSQSYHGLAPSRDSDALPAA